MLSKVANHIARGAARDLMRPASRFGLPLSASAARFNTNITAPQASEPPFPTVIIYNQSKHASNSVLADIRAVWGDRIRVLQTLEDGKQKLPGTDGALFIETKSWGNMEIFKARLDNFCTVDHALAKQRADGRVCFMPGWSAFAESAESARAVSALGLVWPGTEPVASEGLEKIGFKRICKAVGAPTPPFTVLSEEDAWFDLRDPKKKEETIQMFVDKVLAIGTSQKGLVKSIHGGGGKGTAHLLRPDNAEEARASVEKVLNEMNRGDGIYFEEMVNTKGDGRFYQLELEVDGTAVADGGRFVWFNNRLQKVVEIGLSDDHVPLFMPADLYQKSRGWAAAIAKEANNNTRATMEGLVFTDENGVAQFEFIECNRRPQVENEALSLLQRDSTGNRRYTFAELMMRAAGYPAPPFGRSHDADVVLHARWLHGNPDSTGAIVYQAGTVLGMSGPRLDFVPAELMSPGEISFMADPQLGKSVITASSWEEMCDRACTYFRMRKPVVLGSSSTYAQTMYNLFSNPRMRAGQIASNETFKYLDIPKYPTRTVLNKLEDQVAPVMVSGYRPGEGLDPDRWPTKTVCSRVESLTKSLFTNVQPAATEFTRFARGRASYDSYIKTLRDQLSNQGGGWVTVAPRDTLQQGNDSESASICEISRRNAEIYGERAGCVGYENGGAQYQAGLIRGFNPATILLLGLPYNMPAHSLQRSQYVNGLAELPTSIRQPLFDATAQMVAGHYKTEGFGDGSLVPWMPYNFHAGNFYDEATRYSPQDETTSELLVAKCTPMPVWVFSPKFTLDALKKWTGRQIDTFAKHGRTLHQIRIKNPGQGVDWTAEAVWTHCKTMIAEFDARGMQKPIIYIHNHDFNGLASHVGKDVLKLAQADGFTNLVVDAAYRKNITHNDNTIVTSSLLLTSEQKDSLLEYNHIQQQIEHVTCRFNSRDSQMTPWDSDWAGGTEGSDIRICKEFGLDPRLINHAKEVATEVFPIERAVTPFSEYKLRLGIGIMIEDSIQPKTAEAVRAHVAKGGKLKVGGDVLVGLKRWETLVPKTPEVDKLLKNMHDELQVALSAKGKAITVDDLTEKMDASERHTALGYQQKGLEFVTKTQPSGAGDRSPLLVAPHILHGQPLTTPVGTQFELLTDPADPLQRQQVEFQGFGKAPNGDIELTFKLDGASVTMATPDPNAVVGAAAASGPRKATPGNRLELACIVPGEILMYNVAPGDVLKAGEPLCVLESMKMEMKLSVPDELDGLKVKNLPCRWRTKTDQGDVLAPGDLLLELMENDAK